MEELQLIKNCQNGDLTSFTELYDTYVRKIHQFIYYKTHHRETAEDLTATVFMKALENIGTYNSDKSAFKTWLYQIARNSIIDHYRTYRQTGDIEDAWDLHTKDDIENETDIKMRLDSVREYLKTLKADQREIIILRVWGGHSFAEIAEITGKTEAACKMMFGRSIEKLRQDIPMLALLALFLQ